MIEYLKQYMTPVSLLNVHLKRPVDHKRDLVAILALHINIRALLVVAHLQAIVKMFDHCGRKGLEVVHLF